MLGFKPDPEYVEKLKLSAEAHRNHKQGLRERKRKKGLRELYADADDTFAFTAGYTPGGVPYGVTWEEMGEEPADLEEGVKRNV